MRIACVALVVIVLVLVTFFGTGIGIGIGIGTASADERHPHVVTQRFALRLASGAWPMSEYVDAEAGVAFVDDVEGMGDEPRRGAARLLCGAALERRLRATRKELHAKLLGEYATGGLTCSNRGGVKSCEAGGTSEGDTRIRLEFRDDAARGVLLTAIVLDDDDAHADEAVIAREERARRKRIERIRAKRCIAM